jgi:anti-sigma regulatory factor (Ser/Thr protein kinase)
MPGAGQADDLPVSHAFLANGDSAYCTVMSPPKPDTSGHVHDSIDLLPEPRAPGRAREFVSGRLRERVPEDIADVAVLLTSELVTNVVVHARTPMRLDLEVDDRTVRVGVLDEAPRTPALRRAHEARLTGRGMNLVAELAVQWGVDPIPPGKKVWFELPA